MENQNLTAKVTEKSLKSFDGEKFGKLTIIRDCGLVYFPKSRPKRRVLCKCECGKEKELTLADVKSGRITSCGCVLSQVTRERMTKHGMKHTRFYETFMGIKKRCNDINNKEYKNYGGRGIKNEFTSFEHFRDTMLSTYNDDLTIERKDVNGNYSPDNCKWIPMSEQSWNKRYSLKYNGISLIQYCKEKGYSYKLVKDSAGNLNFMDLKIRPIGLSLERIGVGNTDNYLGEQPHFLFKDKRHIQIARITDTTKQLNIGLVKKSNDGFIEQIGGSLNITATGGLYMTDFASPNRPLAMLTIDSLGKLSVSSIAGGGAVQSSLTSTHVGFGVNNVLSSSANFTFLSDRYLHFTGASANVNIGATSSGTAGFLESVNGNLLLQARSTFGVVVDEGYFQVDALGGGGTKMVVVDNSGKFDTQTIPSGGGVPSLTATQIGFGDGSNLLTSSANFTFEGGNSIHFKNGGSSEFVLSRGGVAGNNYLITSPDLEISLTGRFDMLCNGLTISNSGITTILGDEMKLGTNAENTKNEIGLANTDNEIILSGTSFKLNLSDSLGGSYTPSGGDKVLLNWDSAKGAFVLQKLNTVLASALTGSETLLKL